MWIRTILWKTALLWSNIQRHDISDGTLKSALFQRSCHAGLHFAPTFIGLIAILSNGVIVMPQSTLTTIYIYHNSFLVSFTIQNCLKPYSQTTDNVHTFLITLKSLYDNFDKNAFFQQYVSLTTLGNDWNCPAGGRGSGHQDTCRNGGNILGQ